MDSVETKTVETRNIDEEYLRLRVRRKKIGMIVAMAFSFVIALAIIIMSCVNINLKPHFIKEADDITIVTTEVTSGSIHLNAESQHYSDFMNAYNSAFSINTLSALFSGNFGDYTINETADEFIETTSSLNSRLGSNYVKFYYNSPQTLYRKDGSAYAYSKYYTANKITYDTVYFAFNDENGIEEVTFYFAVEGNLSSSNGTAKKSVTTIKVNANTYPIFQNIENFR